MILLVEKYCFVGGHWGNTVIGITISDNEQSAAEKIGLRDNGDGNLIDNSGRPFRLTEAVEIESADDLR